MNGQHSRTKIPDRSPQQDDTCLWNCDQTKLVLNDGVMNVCRFGVSLEDDLLEKLDDFVEKHHFPNRSQAIRHLIRNLHVNEIWQENQLAAGSIVLIYDHHKNRLVNSLLTIQHDFSDLILSSQHVHLDHDNCLETIVVRGKPNDIYALADRLIAVKGVKHGNLAISGF